MTEATGSRQEQLRVRLRAKRVAAGFTLARFARAAGGDPLDWARLEAGLDDAALSEEIITAVGAMAADFPGDDADYAAAEAEERLRGERGFEAVLRQDIPAPAAVAPDAPAIPALAPQDPATADLLIAAFGHDAYLLLTQFLYCDAPERAALLARAIDRAAPNPIKAALPAQP